MHLSFYSANSESDPFRHLTLFIFAYDTNAQLTVVEITAESAKSISEERSPWNLIEKPEQSAICTQHFF
jgi:lipoprotein NlpI